MAHKSKSTGPARKKTAGSKKNPPRSSRGRATPLLRPHRKTAAGRPRPPGPGVRPEATSPTGFTLLVNPTLTLVVLPDDAPVLFSLEAAARLTGVHAELLRYYCRAGLIDNLPGFSENEPCFAASALHEVRRIEHYRRHLAVGRQALPLICELRREAERRHIEIRFLRYP